MTAATYIKQLPDGRYEYGFVIYDLSDRRKDKLDPYGRANSFDAAEFRLSELTAA